MRTPCCNQNASNSSLHTTVIINCAPCALLVLTAIKNHRPFCQVRGAHQPGLLLPGPNDTPVAASKHCVPDRLLAGTISLPVIRALRELPASGLAMRYSPVVVLLGGCFSLAPITRRALWSRGLRTRRPCRPAVTCPPVIVQGAQYAQAAAATFRLTETKLQKKYRCHNTAQGL